MKHLSDPDACIADDQPIELPAEARRALEPRLRYVVFDVRNMFDTVEEAIEAARSMPGFADHYIGCVALEAGLAPANIGGSENGLDNLGKPVGGDSADSGSGPDRLESGASAPDPGDSGSG